jgi:hypothetical protein
MKAPSITPGAGFINFAWPELELRVVVEHFSAEGHAELQFLSANGTGDSLLLQTRVNLLATSAMNSIAKRLKENSQDMPWTEVLTYITGKTLEIARRGEPAVEIWPSEKDTLEVEYLLEPLLYLQHPTVLFGDYGSLKSLMALVIAYVVQLPYHDNTLRLTTARDSTPCLYLDYEDDPSSFQKRWSALERGFAKGAMPIQYRRMTAPLADSAEQLQKIVADKGAKLLIIDSLGPAARGNLIDAEPAIRYHAALRQLGITSLTLAHTAKDQFTKKRSIFGSVFFTNLSRSVWECRAEQETGEDEAVISLKHTKANLSRLHPPLGYRFTFTNNSITVMHTDLKDTGLSGELPLSWQIKNLLRQGAFSVSEIAEQLGNSQDTIRRTLNRMRTKNEVGKLDDGTWGLPLL